MSWVEEEVVRLAQAIARDRVDQQIADAAAGYPVLEAKVAAYLLEHPGATANAVWRSVGGRRQDVLRIVRETRVVPGRFPVADGVGNGVAA